MKSAFADTGPRNRVTVLALFAAAFLLYLPSANFEFIYYDDVRILASHPELYNGQTLQQSVMAILTQLPREEPLLLRDLSWALDSRIFGFTNPHGFHFINVLLHAGVISLCFLALLQITRRYAVAVLGAVGFLSLAIHVDPVAWIMGRKELLLALFGFLALICHSRALDARAPRARYGWYTASLLALTLALFSKISAVVFPGVLFLLALLQPALRGEEPSDGPFPWSRMPKALAGILPHLVVSLMVSHWYCGVLADFGAYDRGNAGAPLQQIATLLVLNPLAWLRDLRLLVAPWNMPVLLLWPGNLTHFELRHVAAAVAIWLTLITLIPVLLHKRRDLAFYSLSFFMLMLPYMNLHYTGIWVAPRYLYFASVCVVALLATVTVDSWRQGARPLAWITASLLLLFCSVNVWCQATALPTWRNAETLWTPELLRPEATPDTFYNLASYYYTTALSATNPVEREQLLQKTESLVARARPRFHKPYIALQNLMLLDALIAVVRNAPTEDRLAKLLAAEQLGPYNDAILWQLMLFYYNKALPLDPSPQRTESARTALAYYARYRTATYQAAGFPAKDRCIQAEFLSDFPPLKSDLKKMK